MRLRAYQPEDLDAVMRLFRDTVHAVNRRDYTPEQLEAWAPEQMDRDRWRERLAGQQVCVAELAGEMVGFCAWTHAGYLDLLFVHGAHQRQGIAGKLCDHAIRELSANRVTQVVTHASITAQPFFARHGFEIVRHQVVTIRGVALSNVVMEQ
jgi:putative acetyltransferase